MKTLILITLVVLTSIVATPRAQALFGHVAAEKERRHEAEQHVAQEQQMNGQLIQTNQGLHTTISVLSAGVTVALVIGAAVGSKTRRKPNNHEQASPPTCQGKLEANAGRTAAGRF